MTMYMVEESIPYEGSPYIAVHASLESATADFERRVALMTSVRDDATVVVLPFIPGPDCFKGVKPILRQRGARPENLRED